MRLTAHQQETIECMLSATKAVSHEGQDKVKLGAVCDRAGILPQTFYNVIRILINRDDYTMLYDLRDALSGLGIEPKCFEEVPPTPRTLTLTRPVIQPISKPTISIPPGITPSVPALIERKEIAIEPEEPAFKAAPMPDMKAAWNIIQSALDSLPQRSREKVISSIESFYGMGRE